MNTTGTINILAMNTRFNSKTRLLPLFLLGLQLGGCSSREETSPQQGAHSAVAHQQQAEMVGEIVRPTNQMVISNQATVKPAYARGAVRVPVQGYITYDIRRNNQVAALCALQ